MSILEIDDEPNIHQCHITISHNNDILIGKNTMNILDLFIVNYSLKEYIFYYKKIKLIIRNRKLQICCDIENNHIYDLENDFELEIERDIHKV